jgi:hypothetical protein
LLVLEEREAYAGFIHRSLEEEKNGGNVQLYLPDLDTIECDEHEK